MALGNGELYVVECTDLGAVGSSSVVKIEAASPTLREALAAHFTAYLRLRDRIVTEQGKIRQHINVFTEAEDVRYTGGLGTTVPIGSDISIIPAVSGG
jgi:molybdopterin synthase sulfur carrier subunit